MAGTGGCEFPVPFWSFASEHYLGITGPVPENAFGRSLSQQLSHLVGEFFDTVAEEVRRGKRHGEVTGYYALDIPHEVGDAGGEDHPWRAEPGAGKGVLEAEGLNRRGALARSPRRTEILPHQLLDVIVRNPRRPGARRDGPPLGLMPDEDHSAARLHHVVDRLGHPSLVGPVERLAERDQSVRPGRHRGKVLGPALDPGDVRDVPLPCGPATLGDHRRIGVKADGALKQVRQSYGEDAGTTPHVQQPSAAIQAEFLSEESLEPGRVGRSPVPVVDSRAIIERRVVSHRRTLPSPRSAARDLATDELVSEGEATIELSNFDGRHSGDLANGRSPAQRPGGGQTWIGEAA